METAPKNAPRRLDRRYRVKEDSLLVKCYISKRIYYTNELLRIILSRKFDDAYNFQFHIRS